MQFAEPREVTASYEWRAQDNAAARTIFIASACLHASACTSAIAVEGFFLSGPLFLLSFLASIGVPIAAGLLAFRGRSRPGKVKVAIDASTRSLVVVNKGGSMRFRREEIRSAWVEKGTCVRVLMKKGQALALDLEDAHAAESFVEELGLAREQRVLEMPLAGWFKTLNAQRFVALSLIPLAIAWTLPALGLGAALEKADSAMLILGLLCGLIVPLGLAIAMVADFRARKVVIGSDGVRVPHRKRVLPYHEIASVDPMLGGVRITKKDRTFVDLPLFRDGQPPFDAFIEQQSALIERIEAWRKNAERTSDEQKFALLDRGDKTVDAWKKELEAIAQPRGGYRIAALSAEDLERVISDAESPGEKRIAATLALSHIDKERATTRVRVVAPTCADDGLREALEKAAEEAELDEQYLTRSR